MTDQFERAFVTGFRQDQENLSYLMLSIIIEKEDFEANCLCKTIWDSYPGIGQGEKIFLLKKTDPTFSTPYLFLLKNNTLKASYSCYRSECEKNGAYFQQKKIMGLSIGVPSYVFKETFYI